MEITENISFWTDATGSLALLISALLIVICFALIAAWMIVALVEAYIIISAGVLLAGFGGSRWTKDYALKGLNYAVSVGAKLFVLQLLVGLGERMVREWARDFKNENIEILVIVGSSIVLVAVCKSIPDLVQGLISGVSLSSGNALAGPVTSAGAAAAHGSVDAAKGAAGGAMAVGAAAALAREQLKSSPTSEGRLGQFAALTGATKGAPASLGGQMMAGIGKTLGNLAGAGMRDVGATLSGHAHHGTMGGRMGSQMWGKAQKMGQERKEGGGQGAGRQGEKPETSSGARNNLQPGWSGSSLQGARSAGKWSETANTPKEGSGAGAPSQQAGSGKGASEGGSLPSAAAQGEQGKGAPATQKSPDKGESRKD